MLTCISGYELIRFYLLIHKILSNIYFALAICDFLMILHDIMLHRNLHYYLYFIRMEILLQVR